MKKAILAIALLLLVSNAHAAGPMDDLLTNSLPNGRFIDSIEENVPGDNSVNYYIMGVIDGLYMIDSVRMGELYPKVVRQDIVEAVKAYYKQNPDQKYRPIADVIYSGCK